MIEKLWVYNLDTATVDWAYASRGWVNNSWWVCRTDGDGTATNETLGYGAFLTEKEATEGLLKALMESKDEIECAIEKVQRQLASFQ